MSAPDVSGPPAGEGARLMPPPRPVPEGLPLYLLLLASQLGWLFLGMGMLAFWFNCAFGADVKSLLFLVPPPTVSGTVTGFEATPLIEGTGTSYVAGNLRHATGAQPIFAVHYTYALPGGGTGRGTSYEGASLEGGPMVETPTVVAPVAVGLPVPVQYVRAFPSVSRIQGMRSNVYPLYALGVLVYPLYALGVLVFALAGAAMLRPALKNLRRVRFLLESGVEDAEHKNLEDRTGRLPALSLEGPLVRWLGIRDGRMHPPGPLQWAKVLLIPIGGLAVNVLYLWHYWGGVVYTFHCLRS